jgi:hypothetical protein
MVTRSTRILASLLLGLALTGCPDDLGKNLGPAAASPVASPTNLVATANGFFEVRLSWRDNAVGELGYRLEMCHADFRSAAPEFRILAADSSSVTYAAVPNTFYRFRVFAITADLESEPSNEVTVTTPAVLPPPGVTASSEAPTEAVVSWGDVSGETGYSVEISADGGSTWSTAASAGEGQLSVQVQDLIPDTEYLFRVSTVYPNILSDPSEEVGVVMLTRSISRVPVTNSSSDCGKGVSFVLSPPGAIWITSYSARTSNVIHTCELGHEPGIGLYTGAVIDSGPTGHEDVGGDGTSIVLDGAGKAHVLAHDRTNNTLRYVAESAPVWPATTIDTTGGAKPRIAWNPANGALHAVYQSSTTQLKHLVRPAGQPWGSGEVLNHEIDSASMHAVAVDSSGAVHVVLINSRKELLYGIKPLAAGGWSFQTLPLPSQTMRPASVSMALDAIRTPHVAIQNALDGGLYHLTRRDALWELEAVDRTPGASVGSALSLAIHPASGRLHVAYYDATHGDLKYARKDATGSWTRRLLDAVGDVGSHVSMTLDAAGEIAVAYRDGSQGVLKLARGTP